MAVVAITTLKTLAELEQEMARAGRAAEEEALRDARRTLARRRDEFVTTGEAAEQLGVSIPTVKRRLTSWAGSETRTIGRSCRQLGRPTPTCS